MKVIVLTIGDEILIGQVTDTNSAWIGKNLAKLGITIQEIRSIQDEENAIKHHLEYAVEQADLVITTGGLGPTKDDITKKAIADFTGAKMVFSNDTFKRIEQLFQKFGRPMSSSHRDQCYMPENAQLLLNRMGTAPGMLFHHNNTQIVSMPGVPYEMKAIMTDHVLPMISSNIDQEDKIYSRTIMTAGIGETTIEDTIRESIRPFEPLISVAYLPSLGSVRVRITTKKANQTNRQLVDDLTQKVSLLLSDAVYGFDGVSLSKSLMDLCVSKHIMVGTAESCTGGYVSHLITQESGSSAYYAGSTITYTNQLKNRILGVKESTLAQFGAVSEQTVIQMAKGLLTVLNVDLAVSISGIAGPSGGTPEKPVGTIWLCVANSEHHHAFKINASKDRSKNIEYAGSMALNALRKFVLKHY